MRNKNKQNEKNGIVMEYLLLDILPKTITPWAKTIKHKLNIIFLARFEIKS